jgi:predicted nucleic acid-binding protein
MSVSFIDADVIIRLLTGDDPIKQADCRSLFERIERGDEIVNLPHTVVADVVFVLRSPRLYRLAKSEIAELLTALISFRGIRINDRQSVLGALALYGAHARLDFTDALIISMSGQHDDAVVYSYDTDYDRFDEIVRREP